MEGSFNGTPNKIKQTHYLGSRYLSLGCFYITLLCNDLKDIISLELRLVLQENESFDFSMKSKDIYSLHKTRIGKQIMHELFIFFGYFLWN